MLPPYLSLEMRLFTARSLALAYLLISGVLYAARYTQFSPVYILTPTALLLFVCAFGVSRKALQSPDCACAILMIVVMVFPLVNNEINGAYLNGILGYLTYIAVRVASYKHLGLQVVRNAISISSVPCVIYIALDTAVRFINPELPTDEYANHIINNEYSERYLYKFGGWMFADSNSSGLLALAFMLMRLEVFDNWRKPTLVDFMFFTLCLLSLSWSIYIVLVMVFVWKSYQGLSRSVIEGLLVVVLPLGIFIIAATWNYLISMMSSFLSIKLFTASKAIDYFSHASLLERIFGVGPGMSLAKIGIYTHTHVLTYLIEMGIIGLFIFLSFQVLIYVKSKTNIQVSLLIAGMSYYFYLGAPFLLVTVAIVSRAASIQRDGRKDVRRKAD